jgi:four helix bundle protein
MQILKKSTVRSCRDLVAWQKAMTMVTDIYRFTELFPKTEIYGLTAQLRRAAVSVPSNIAEGQGRSSTGEFRQFLGHARGSLLEVETQLQIALNLEYLNSEHCANLLGECFEVGKVLNGLIAALPRNRCATTQTDH